MSQFEIIQIGKVIGQTIRTLITLGGIVLIGCNHDFVNPSDPKAERFTVKSETFVKRLGDFELIEGDTGRFFGGITSQPVIEDGLVESYAWDIDGDGKNDTVTKIADTISIPMTHPGDARIRFTIKDKAGFLDTASILYHVHPQLKSQFHLQTLDPDCPAYAQVPELMRLVLALSQFTVEKTKQEGISNSEFIWKIAGALTGMAYPIGAFGDLKYSFSKGIYHFQNGASNIDLAFHYGPGLEGHASGDTIRSNLFDLDSYLKITDITLIPPTLKYSRGPLAELIDGNIEVNTDDIRHPKFNFSVDFNRIQISFFRSTNTLLVFSNQAITLANALFLSLYEGRAKMNPIYPPDLLRLYSKDSLDLDFSGTRISSPELSLSWPYKENGIADTAVYRVGLFQETLNQHFRFGNADGINKVFGNYTAINRLGGKDTLESVYFQGEYSSLGVDRAKFYCHEEPDSDALFGIAAFETPIKDQGDFQSERYDYGFSFPFSTIEPWSGNPDQLPETLKYLKIYAGAFELRPWY